MIAQPHAMLTIVAPLALDKLNQAEAEIDALSKQLPALVPSLDALDAGTQGGTHFMSLHAIASTDGKTAYLLLEMSADGSLDAAIDRILNKPALEVAFRRIFVMASDWKDGVKLKTYLTDKLLTIGSGYFDNPGLPFVGAPGLSVGRIQDEAKLAAVTAATLAGQPGALTGLERLGRVRTEVAKNASLKHLLQPAETSINFEQASPLASGFAVLGIVVRTYLWPVVPVVLIAALITGAFRAWGATGLKAIVTAFLHGAWSGFWISGLVALIATIAIAVAAYLGLRAAEDRDPTDDRAPDHAVNAAMFALENVCAQNHMISITRRKPGLLRAFTSRLVFLVIGSLCGRLYPPGFLGSIGTIHFARWVTPKGSRDLFFLSNYDGSWESYLEDFITRAHDGLTAVWTNTIGFPRAENLFQKGATDGERFKRFARRSMVPTRFWYSAYPGITVAAIRRNSLVRQGLSGALNEDEAQEWLAQFGSAHRPDARLVSSGIQSLVFGGMGFMPFGTCLVFDKLPGDPHVARDLLAELTPLVAFNDGRLAGTSAVTLALGAGALERLGLPASARDSFPFAFIEGMTGGSRSRILGDEGANAPQNWAWGKTAPDLALLVYGKSRTAIAALDKQICGRAAGVGMAAPYRIPLMAVHDGKHEPFGFADGVSQPVIRGTYKGLRNADPIHLVEPGEFILGYPDNRGNLAPGPTLPAIADPSNLLPLVQRVEGFDTNSADAPRDLGFNGSFLVIRELAQDVGGFWACCEREAKRLAGRLPQPYLIDKIFVAAKMIGRWPDGSSLVRNPYEPASAKAKPVAPLARPIPAVAGGKAAIQPPGPTAAASLPKFHGDNDYLFGPEDPEGVRCPFGAHVRRANPRDSQDPGSADQIAISNRHRILRVGRRYAPKKGQSPGLLFMCLNGDIERQFEFLQQTWLRSPSFHGLSGEKDPLLGDAEKDNCGYTIPSREGPVSLGSVPQFVTVKGGGYFFLPGKRFLEYLARDDG